MTTMTNLIHLSKNDYRYGYIIKEVYCARPEEIAVPCNRIVAEEMGWYSLEQAKKDAESLMFPFDEIFQDNEGRTWKRVVEFYRYKITTEKI